MRLNRVDYKSRAGVSVVYPLPCCAPFWLQEQYKATVGMDNTGFGNILLIPRRSSDIVLGMWALLSRTPKAFWEFKLCHDWCNY